jgi:hypothetical protein
MLTKIISNLQTLNLTSEEIKYKYLFYKLLHFHYYIDDNITF